MQLKLKRTDFTGNSTIGELYVNEIFECYVLEDTVREGDIFKVKVKGETAIPRGTYKVIIDESARFKRLMPHILDVPNFAGVRIHSGNDKDDTEGCILTGTFKGIDFVGESKIAFTKLFDKLTKAFHDSENIYITIEGVPPIPAVYFA